MKHNGGFSSFLEHSGQIIILSVLWTVSCLPVITLGAASAALYQAVVKSVRCERSSPFKVYAKALRTDLAQGAVLTLILVVYAVLAVNALYFSRVYPGVPTILRAIVSLVGGVSLFLILLAAPYAHIFLSRFRMSALQCLKASLYCAAGNVKCTALMLLTSTAGGLLLYLIPLFFVWIPGTVCYIHSFLFEPLFKKYLSQLPDGSGPDDPWYMEL